MTKANEELDRGSRSPLSCNKARRIAHSFIMPPSLGAALSVASRPSVCLSVRPAPLIFSKQESCRKF